MTIPDQDNRIMFSMPPHTNTNNATDTQTTSFLDGLDFGFDSRLYQQQQHQLNQQMPTHHHHHQQQQQQNPQVGYYDNQSMSSINSMSTARTTNDTNPTCMASPQSYSSELMLKELYMLCETSPERRRDRDRYVNNIKFDRFIIYRGKFITNKFHYTIEDIDRYILNETWHDTSIIKLTFDPYLALST